MCEILRVVTYFLSVNLLQLYTLFFTCGAHKFLWRNKEFLDWLDNFSVAATLRVYSSLQDGCGRLLKFLPVADDFPKTPSTSQPKLSLGGSGRFRQPLPYHWRELPQVSFLSRQTFCRDKHTFVTTRHVLSRQTRVCRNKNDTCGSSRQWYDKSMLVALCDKHVLVATNVFRGKHTFVATKDVFCHEKGVFVVTKLLSRQKCYLWRLQPTILPELGKITLIMEICKATTPAAQSAGQA